MSASDHLNGQQFLRLYHGTSERDAESIRQTGLRPSKKPVFGHVPTLTDSEAEARKYAGPIGHVVAFDIPQEYAGHHMTSDWNLDGDAHVYTIRKTLPAKFAQPGNGDHDDS
ncbi:MAG TPA: hypothetical protein VFO01_11490 [Trebonia sp.]|nr:hypothetical protein [Trebonia sp.]